MFKIVCTPSINDVPAECAFGQTLVAFQGKQEVGRLAWHAGPSADVAQLLSVHVAEQLRRTGIGSKLLSEAYAQCRLLSKRRGKQVSRFWCILEHEHDIVARAFLFKHGYHHVGTVIRLYRDQDAMAYVKSFD